MHFLFFEFFYLKGLWVNRIENGDNEQWKNENKRENYVLLYTMYTCLPLLFNNDLGQLNKMSFNYQSHDNISGVYFENKCFSIPVCVLLICN